MMYTIREADYERNQEFSLGVQYWTLCWV